MSIDAPSWSGDAFDVMRIGVGLTVLLASNRMQFFRPSGTPSDPLGIARFIPLGWLSSQRTARRMRTGMYVALLCYVADVLVPYALLYLSVALLLEVTFHQSFGSVNAGIYLPLLVVIAQAVAVVVWNAASRFGWELGQVAGGSRASTAAWWSVQVMLAAYFTSGISKLIATRGAWIQRSPGLILEVRARRDTDVLQYLGRNRLLQPDRALAPLLDRPVLARVFFAAGLVVELAAPLGLFGKTALLLVGLALLGLHSANGWLLGLGFPEWQLLVLTFFVLPRFV